jgi:general nucleoside transport system permease protein
MNGLHISVLGSTIDIMTPLLLAAMGGLYSSLAGVLNIALEGLMVFSAFFSVVFTVATGSLLLGIVGGVLATLLLTLLFGAVSLGLRANIFICGLATNLLAAALTIVLSFSLYGKTGSVNFPTMPLLVPVRVPFLEGIPVLGDVLSGHVWLVYVSWLLLALTALIVYRTPFGMRLRAVGFNAKAALALGVSPRRFQLGSLLISGFTCALAGAMLTLTLGAFVPNVSSGRGWIALVIIYLGKRTPLGILLGSIVFGLVEYASNYLQAASSVPSGLLLAMPFFVTVIVLVIYSVAENNLRKARSMSLQKKARAS